MKIRLTPMRAIRKKCLDCSCGNSFEVSNCPVTDCPLYEYRTGKKPGKEVWYEDGRPEPTEKEKQKRIEIGKKLYEKLKETKH